MAMTSWRDATLWRDNVFYYTSKKPGVLMDTHLSLTVPAHILLARVKIEDFIETPVILELVNQPSVVCC